MSQIAEFSPPVVQEIELQPLESRGALVHYSDVPLPRRRPPVWRRFDDLLLFVGLPAAAAFLYLFVIATPYYVSEAQFVVRSNSNSGSAGGLESLVQSQGLSRSSDETYVIDDYIKSRDIVRQLAANDHLREIFSRPETDAITRFPNFYSRNNFEQLYKHYQKWIKVDLDEGTGITTLRADAYRPQDARDFLGALLKHAEELINRLNVRSHEDAMHYANFFVEEERKKLADVETRLTEFRSATGMVDPTKEAMAAVGTLGNLNTQVAELEATLRQQIAVMPTNPGIADLKLRIKSYQDEIEKLRHQVAGAQGSTASNVATFEGLVLERELEAKSLGAAVDNLNEADREAQQGHLYLETITEPNLPDAPERLERILSFGLVLAIALSVWSIQRALKRDGAEQLAHA